MDEFRKDFGTLYKFGKSTTLYGAIMFLLFCLAFPWYVVYLGFRFGEHIINGVNKHQKG